MTCFLGILQGCQANPDKDTVVNKNEGKLDAAIQETADGEKENIAPSYTDTFTVGDVSVNVDASVISIDSALPVVRVTPREITAEEVKHWTDVLFEGKTAYEPSVQMTKTELEQYILRYKEIIGDRESLAAEYGSGEDADAMIDYYNNLISAYEQEYETAPDKEEKTECDWNFHPYDYYMNDSASWEGDESFEKLKKTYKLKAVTTGLNGHSAIVDATNRDESDYMIHSLWFYYTDEEMMTDIPYTEISEKEAERIATDALDSLGMSEHWSLWSAYGYTNMDEDQKPLEDVYVLQYTPVYEGVRAIPGPEIDLQSEDLYAANYRYENLVIRIHNGILRNVELESPMDQVSVENDNVKTLSMEEVYDQFKTQAQAQFTRSSLVDMSDPAAAEGDLQIKITEISQGLFRIKEQDSDEFLMVPVWSFNGTLSLDGVDDANGMQNFVVINALDGSVIDTTLGY